MKNKCLSAIAQYKMIDPGDHIVVALSGGADSIALLHFLHKHAQELCISVSAAHFNHGIRGSEADEDALFCQCFCQQYGIDFVTTKADVPAVAAKRKLGIEECARILRYEFLQSVADCAKIATAHTNSDSCESLLFNLARGTGLQGLCGIPAVRNNIIRPFVFCSAEDTRQYCRENKIDWREDSTNLKTDYARNRIRHEIVPHMKEVNSAFEDNALRCMQILQSENDFLQAVASSAYAECRITDQALDVHRFECLHPAIAIRVLLCFAQLNGCKNVTMHQLSLLMRAKDGEVITFSGDVRFKKDKNRIYIQEAVANIQPLCVSVNDFNSRVSFFDTYVNFHHLQYNEGSVENRYAVDADKLSDVVLRTRLPGDNIRLANRKCTKTLKQLFNEKKIPLQQRQKIPVLADEKGLIWVGGFGTDESRLPDKNTKNIIIIEWRNTL